MNFFLKRCHKPIFACSTVSSYNIRYKDWEKTYPKGVLLKKIFASFMTQKLWRFGGFAHITGKTSKFCIMLLERKVVDHSLNLKKSQKTHTKIRVLSTVSKKNQAIFERSIKVFFLKYNKFLKQPYPLIKAFKRFCTRRNIFQVRYSNINILSLRDCCRW